MSKETPEQRQRRYNTEYVRARRANETPEEHAQHLRAERVAQKRRRDSETPEQREKRRAYHREHERMRRSRKQDVMREGERSVADVALMFAVTPYTVRRLAKLCGVGRHLGENAKSLLAFSDADIAVLRAHREQHAAGGYPRKQ